MTRRHSTMTETPAPVTCRCCGVVLPQPALAIRFDQVVRNEHVKRAIEVALTGGFRIAITGAGASYPEALALAQIARRHGLTVFCLAPCPCGNFGDATRACTCTPLQIVRMRAQKRYQTALRADLHVEAAMPPEARLGVSRPGEPDERILERIAEAQQRTLPAIERRDSAAESLMRAAIRQLDLPSSDVARLWTIAAVIAQLAGRDVIGPAHLAEAVQYRRRHALHREPVE